MPPLDAAISQPAQNVLDIFLVFAIDVPNTAHTKAENNHGIYRTGHAATAKAGTPADINETLASCSDAVLEYMDNRKTIALLHMTGATMRAEYENAILDCCAALTLAQTMFGVHPSAARRPDTSD